MNYKSIGFLWGSARVSGDYFLAQSTDRGWIEKVKTDLELNKAISTVKTARGNESWRMKIPLDHPYFLWMLEQGYVGRLEEQRDMPFLSSNDEAEFLRGYFSVHHTLDNLRGRLRLRFYASELILVRLTSHLNAQLGVGLKKTQGHSASSVCKILYYQSPTEVEKVNDYLFGGIIDD